MAVYLLVAATVIIACVICTRISNKVGIPMLLAFILLGMFFGSDGILKIPFDNYVFAEQICSVALIFIMFYGGFGTNWKAAKPVAAKALLLSSAGTVLTALGVGVFCHFVLDIAMLESFLIGAVISSTDAASVFSILRSKRLNLKDNTASLLEIESGSNDPFSYMLTVLLLALMQGEQGLSFGWMLAKQLGFGLLFGFGVAYLTLFVLKKAPVLSSGFYAIFVVAVAIVAYAAPSALGGNGYLAVYITGMILGNSRIANKQELVHFFDATTGLMQMLLFFLLGLLAFPSQLPAVTGVALLVALALTFVVRPLVVFLLLTPFKSSWRQQLLVAWSGMRGAASIVFSIMVVIHPASTDHDVFHMVFFIVLFSILIQGTLIPWVTRWLKMTDDTADVRRTFNDYMDENRLECIQFTLPEGHPWVGQRISQLVLPPGSLVVMLRRGTEQIAPNGRTLLKPGDLLVLSGSSAEQAQGLMLLEHTLEKGDPMIGKTLAQSEYTEKLVLVIRRKGKGMIPTGSTKLQEGDVLLHTQAPLAPKE